MGLLSKDAIVFGWGASVYACTPAVWDDILKEIAGFNGSGLETMVQARCQRLSDAPFRHLGLITRDEAKVRLEARDRARRGEEEPPPVERKRFEQPKLKGAGAGGDSRSATPPAETVKRQKPAAPHAATVAKPGEKKNRK